MQIKRSSWHYRLTRSNYGERANDNICRYFWRVVGRLLFLGLLCAVVLFLIVALMLSHAVVHVVVVTLFIVLSVALPIIVISFARAKNHGNPLRLPGEEIVVAYLKAKKDNLCPLIEYVD